MLSERHTGGSRNAAQEETYNTLSMDLPLHINVPFVVIYVPSSSLRAKFPELGARPMEDIVQRSH